MNVYNIDTATHGETYQVFIPKAIADTIRIRLYDGDGTYPATLEEGFYTALCKHDIYAIGQPKYWEILGTGHTENDPTADNKEIKGVSVKDLKIAMGV